MEASETTEPRLAIFQKEEAGRQGNVARADECGYKLFKIGWTNLFSITFFFFSNFFFRDHA